MAQVVQPASLARPAHRARPADLVGLVDQALEANQVPVRGKEQQSLLAHQSSPAPSIPPRHTPSSHAVRPSSPARRTQHSSAHPPLPSAPLFTPSPPGPTGTAPGAPANNPSSPAGAIGGSPTGVAGAGATGRRQRQRFHRLAGQQQWHSNHAAVYWRRLEQQPLRSVPYSRTSACSLPAYSKAVHRNHGMETGLSSAAFLSKSFYSRGRVVWEAALCIYCEGINNRGLHARSRATKRNGFCAVY